jgi:hypothetical protein
VRRRAACRPRRRRRVHAYEPVRLRRQHDFSRVGVRGIGIQVEAATFTLGSRQRSRRWAAQAPRFERPATLCGMNLPDVTLTSVAEDAANRAGTKVALDPSAEHYARSSLSDNVTRGVTSRSWMKPSAFSTSRSARPGAPRCSFSWPYATPARKARCAALPGHARRGDQGPGFGPSGGARKHHCQASHAAMAHPPAREGAVRDCAFGRRCRGAPARKPR